MLSFCVVICGYIWIKYNTFILTVNLCLCCTLLLSGILGFRWRVLRKAIFEFPGPLFQNEARCSAFDMEIIFHSHANNTHFHEKGCAPSLILKVRVFGTRKWPIFPTHFPNQTLSNFFLLKSIKPFNYLLKGHALGYAKEIKEEIYSVPWSKRFFLKFFFESPWSWWWWASFKCLVFQVAW